MTKYKFIGATLVLFAACCTTAQAKLYKWVDDEGVTHYGEIIPPEFADKDRVQLNTPKPTSKKLDTGKEAPKEKTPEQVEQERRDNALINTFASEKEIDADRDKKLALIEVRINGIKQRMDTFQSSLDEHNKEKEGLTKAGKPVHPMLLDDIKDDETRIAKLQKELAATQDEAAATKARFEADKQRYRQLKGMPEKPSGN